MSLDVHWTVWGLFITGQLNKPVAYTFHSVIPNPDDVI
jgi:hypothetical protein